MKKTNLDNKLKLNTETLMPLQADALESVNGGAGISTVVTTAVTRLSCVSCACIPTRLLTGGGQGGQ